MFAFFILFVIIGSVLTLSSMQYKVRKIKKEDYKQVKKLASETYFPPRISWKRGPEEIIVSALKKGKCSAIGVFFKEELVSYLDYKESDQEAKIGFCMTKKEHRSKSLMSRLIELLLERKNKEFFVETHEDNKAMIRALKRQGFKESARKIDRTDGKETVVYTLKP